MVAVNDIFERGPEAVSGLFSGREIASGLEPMDAKRLADDCWTRASSLARSGAPEARRWALAALAGYEFLSNNSDPIVAESASENAEALRSWSLLS